MGKTKGSTEKPAKESSSKAHVATGRYTPEESGVAAARSNVSATRPEPRPPSRPAQRQRRQGASEPNRPDQTGKETQD